MKWSVEVQRGCVRACVVCSSEEEEKVVVVVVQILALVVAGY